MSKIAIEVGANHGTDTHTLLQGNYLVYAFEPLPELHLGLKNKFKDHPNYHPVPLAADIKDGWSSFNIAGAGGWGCSSLHEFNPNINTEWPGRDDFVTTEHCPVMTIRLDTFMNIYGIDRVDYLWIDAQGNDFNVLQSLGDRVKDVVQGRCEVALGANLYADVNNRAEDVNHWLKQQGFGTYTIPHPHHKEADILFSRTPTYGMVDIKF